MNSSPSRGSSWRSRWRVTRRPTTGAAQRWSAARTMNGSNSSSGGKELRMTTDGDAQTARNGLIEQVAEKVREVTGAERSAVEFGEDANATIHFVAASGPYAERIRGARARAEGSGLCGNVLDGGCSIRRSKLSVTRHPS